MQLPSLRPADLHAPLSASSTPCPATTSFLIQPLCPPTYLPAVPYVWLSFPLL